MTNLQGKVVLITGAKGGLGTTVTNAILSAGATVVGVSRSIQQSDFDSPEFHALSGELTDGASARAVVEQAIAKAKRVDALVHLVGGFEGGKPVAETDETVFDQMISLNLRSAFLMIRAVVPPMRERGSGRIIAIGSRTAIEASPNVSLYAASKAALVSLVRSVASENARHGITANVLLPGTMDTPLNRKVMPAADTSKWIQPQQVANLIVQLASDELSQVTGAAIPIYGRDV